MDKYVELRNYIEQKINRLNREQDRINELVNLLEKIEGLIEELSGDYTLVDRATANDLLKTIFNEDYTSDLNNIGLFVQWFDDSLLGNEPQVVAAKAKLEKLIDSLESYLAALEIKVYNEKNNDNSVVELSIYQKYLSKFNDEGIVQAFDTSELEGFLNFIKEAPLNLSDDECLELIMDFSKYNLDYQIRMLNNKTTFDQSVVSQNSRELFEELNGLDIVEDTPIMEQEENVISNEIVLSEEEQQKYNQILQIVDELRNKVGKTDDISNFIARGDYSLNSHINLYDATVTQDEKWSVVLQDLNRNLISGLATNKEEVMIIFDYILSMYERDFLVREEITPALEVPVLYSFSKDEEKVLEDANLMLNDFEHEILEYRQMNATDKNYIDSIYGLILDNNLDDISKSETKFSIVYVNFIKELEKLSLKVSELNDVLTSENDYRIECGNQEVDSMIKNYLDSIKSCMTNINLFDEQRHSVEEETNTSEIDVIDALDNAKNLVIFLPNSNGYRKSYAEEDLDNVIDINHENLPYIVMGLNKLVAFNKTNAADTGVERLVSKGYPSFIRKKVKPFKFRQGEARFAFVNLPLSSDNQHRLQKDYGIDSEKTNVVMVLGFFKKNGEKIKYERLLSRIVKEEKQIYKIQDIFGNDFTPETYAAATELIQDGLDMQEFVQRRALDYGR